MNAPKFTATNSECHELFALANSQGFGTAVRWPNTTQSPAMFRIKGLNTPEMVYGHCIYFLDGKITCQKALFFKSELI